ncbi:MAG: DUF2892 domain-containing protein [Candidatus Nanohaloarchaea archaeon]
MEENVGNKDRQARLFVGAFLTVIGLAGYAGYVTLAFGPLPQALTSVVSIVIGAVLLVTGATNKCLLYSALDMDTK